MSGEGIAAILVGIGTLVTQLGSVIMQFKQAKVTAAQGSKIDDVHAATAAIAEQTGTHPALKSE